MPVKLNSINANATSNATNVGEEVDVVYTHFFTPGNHVAWQIGGGVFLPGDVYQWTGVVEVLPNKLGAIPNSG